MPDAQGMSKSARKRANRRKREKSRSTQNTQPSRKSNQAIQVAISTTSSKKRRGQRRKKRNSSGKYTRSASYLDTLRDPERFTGVKVPDIVSFPSGTFQLTIDSVMFSGTGGDSCMMLVNPIIGDGSGNIPVTYYNGTSAGSLSSQSGVNNWANRAGIAGLFDAFRPVSGVCTAEFIGPTVSDGGILCGALLPNPTGTGLVKPTTWSEATSQPNSVSGPLRNGMRVTWRPQDNSDNEYNGVVGGNYACMMIAATGLPSAATYLKVRVCINFEALPGSDTANLIQTENSPINLTELARAMGWAAQTPPGQILFGAFSTPFLQPRRQRLLM